MSILSTCSIAKKAISSSRFALVPAVLLMAWSVSGSGSETQRRLGYETAQDFDVIITMGCGDACPIFPGKRYED